MAWPVYMDVHVPAAITAGLRRRGLDVLTSQEDGSDTLSDERLLEELCNKPGPGCALQSG